MSDLKLEYLPYHLKFREPAGTSRGILIEKLTYLIRISQREHPECVGYGEVPVFPGLSAESPEEVLLRLKTIAATGLSLEDTIKEEMSSVQMGLETALLNLKNGGGALVFDSPFTNNPGRNGIEINGLIWMGNFNKMRERVDEKLSRGFRCIKIKIGAIDREEELELIRYVRDKGGSTLSIRLDANGAFTPEESISRLEELAHYGIHSIEQPIRPGNPEEMRKICRDSPIPVALDEELIGLSIGPERDELLDFIKPQYIILKPALCFGFTGARDWITRAGERGMGWWITSALESSVGLNAIAQFTATLQPKLPQGLGTGNLFINNLPSTLSLKGDRLHFSGEGDCMMEALSHLPWQN